MSHGHAAHAEQRSSSHGSPGRPYLMFWLNMVLGLAVMYVVMFSMIDGWSDFRNNLNMFYMAVTMWAPMGIFMLATMPGMYPNWSLRGRNPDRSWRGQVRLQCYGSSPDQSRDP